MENPPGQFITPGSVNENSVINGEQQIIKKKSKKIVILLITYFVVCVIWPGLMIFFSFTNPVLENGLEFVLGLSPLFIVFLLWHALTFLLLFLLVASVLRKFSSQPNRLVLFIFFVISSIIAILGTVYLRAGVEMLLNSAPAFSAEDAQRYIHSAIASGDPSLCDKAPYVKSDPGQVKSMVNDCYNQFAKETHNINLCRNDNPLEPCYSESSQNPETDYKLCLDKLSERRKQPGYDDSVEYGIQEQIGICLGTFSVKLNNSTICNEIKNDKYPGLARCYLYYVHTYPDARVCDNITGYKSEYYKSSCLTVVGQATTTSSQ